jgi:cellulose synthase/poly-beta-1,6-N-acetylglucosamine synthase-like glycosyltransferase
MHLVFVVVFLGTILYGCAFQLMQLDLVRTYWLDVIRSGKGKPALPLPDSLPSVTIQLPMYNESAVAERVLDAVLQIEYPRDRLQVQVLDDSTDLCTQILVRKLAEIRAADPTIRIDYRHRTDRTGFKAGNLNEGMPEATGELVAIFDADFIPGHDFLLRTVPCFSDPAVAAVQSRWGHLNAGDSNLTRVQELFLNGHHTVEQRGRCEGGLFLVFNGSAGIWRTDLVRSLGGWCTETTTEDLVMSFRAQLAGYRIQFLEDYVTPGELPDSILGFRVQMFRWLKGGAQGCIRFLPQVWRTRMPLRRRLHATSLLMSSFTMPVTLLNILMSGMLPLVLRDSTAAQAVMPLALLGIGWFPLLLLVYGSAAMRFGRLPLWQRAIVVIVRTLSLLMMTAGLACQSTVAVVEAFLGRKNQWVVTPKGFSTSASSGTSARTRVRFPWYFWLDALVLTYLICSMGVAIAFSAWHMIVILSVWLAGSMWFFGGALIEAYWPGPSPKPIRHDDDSPAIIPPLGVHAD